MQDSKKPIIGICVAEVQDDTTARLINSLCDNASQNGVQLQIFASFSKLYNQDNWDIGEKSIFNLIRFERLSALIVFSEKIKDEAIAKQLIQAGQQQGIPVISIDQQHVGCYNVVYEYVTPFEQVVRHVFEHHKCKRVNFIAGMKDNAFSDARVDVYKKLLAESGLPFEERRLKYGDFWDYPAKQATYEFLEDEVPEAIICANDIMAIATCDALVSRGYRVPEDVIVTGFDGVDLERYHVPRLTTSAQDVAFAGQSAIALIVKLLQGERIAPYTLPIRYEVRYSQSCGCVPIQYRSANNQVVKLYNMLAELRQFERTMFDMVTALTDDRTIMEFPDYLRPFLMQQSYDTAQLCVSAKFLEAAGIVPQDRLSENDMYVLAERWGDTYSKPMARFAYAEQSMKLTEILERTNQILFVPIHDQSEVFGYLAIGFHTLAIDYNCLLSFSLNLSHSLNTVQSQSKLLHMNNRLSDTNRELANMYIHDSMTGLFNRRGFFQELKNQIGVVQEDTCWLYIASVDMDSLKYINDTFGHSEGDFAIKTVANMMVLCAGARGICARFGGDEYIMAMVTVTPEEDGCGTYAQRLCEKLEECNHVFGKPYSIGASCGTELAILTPTLDIDALMKSADDKMYHQKAKRKCLRGSAR